MARPGEFPSSRPDFLHQVRGARCAARTHRPVRHVGPTALAPLIFSRNTRLHPAAIAEKIEV
jgi:hypothetical protein